MYYFLQKFHSGWAYLALLMLTIAVIVSAAGFFSKKTFTATHRKIALFALITIHIQLVIGMFLYFISPAGFALLGEMKDASIRLTSLEHPVTNILAVILITIGWSKHKKQLFDTSKFKMIAIFYGLGLILILSKLPWSSWTA